MITVIKDYTKLLHLLPYTINDNFDTKKHLYLSKIILKINPK